MPVVPIVPEELPPMPPVPNVVLLVVTLDVPMTVLVTVGPPLPVLPLVMEPEPPLVKLPVVSVDPEPVVKPVPVVGPPVVMGPDTELEVVRPEDPPEPLGSTSSKGVRAPQLTAMTAAMPKAKKPTARIP
jgi:hypothetical protein